MPCNTILDDNGQPVGFVCTASWGMGVLTFRWKEEDGTECEDIVYGFGGSGDPHDFEPSFEENTAVEITAWMDAIEAIEGEIYLAYFDKLWGETPGLHILWRSETDEFDTRVRLI